MNGAIFYLFLYYAGMFWHEFERMLSILIKAKYQEAANNKRWSYPHRTLKGERRCCRGTILRGRPGKPGKASVYKPTNLLKYRVLPGR
jgi:hypothetical protein